MSDFQESYAHLADGRPIPFFEEGAGEPFLYVHMSAGSAENAGGVSSILRDRFRCIALDRVGYHRSGTLDRLTTVEEQVEAIAAVHTAPAPQSRPGSMGTRAAEPGPSRMPWPTPTGCGGWSCMSQRCMACFPRKAVLRAFPP